MVNTTDKHQRAMLRATMELAEERAQARIDKLVRDRVETTNSINMTLVMDAINSAALSIIGKQPTPQVNMDMTPIANEVGKMLAIIENQPVPQVNVSASQVNVDMSSVALAIDDITRMVVAQNENITVLGNTLAKLLKILIDQKPTESSSITALVKEQHDFFSKVVKLLEEKHKPRQIYISHSETESVVTEK